MDWVTIITLVLKAVSGVVEFLNSRKLLDAGAAEALAQGLQGTLDNLAAAQAASEEIKNNPDGEYAKSIRDKYTRPGE